MCHLFTLVALACEVYVRRARFNPPLDQTIPLIERFRRVTESVKGYGDVVGQHLLAWPYFVMAAESSTKGDREFFHSELLSLYQTTGCQSALRGLEKVIKIWEKQANTRWTSLLGGNDQFFIM
jgi:hypothetical protein